MSAKKAIGTSSKPLERDVIKPSRNELEQEERHNEFPQPDDIDPRKLGLAGVRIKLDMLLNAVHGFDDEVFAALAIDKRDIARYRKQATQLLRRMVADPEENRTTNRSAAVVLLGELAGADSLPELAAVLESPDERLTTRGWAALTIGRVAGEEGAELLSAALDSPSPPLRRRVAEGLGATGSRGAIEPLRRLAKSDGDSVTANLALGLLHELEDRHGLERTKLERREPPVRRRRRLTELREEETY